MSTQHLSDTQIQDWVEGNLSDASAAARHLENCPHCQAEVATYRELFQELEKPAEFSLSPDFAVNVTRQIQTDGHRFSSQWWSWLLITCGFLLGIGINVYYLGAETIFSGMERFKDSFVRILLTFEFVKRAAVSLNFNQSLIFVAVLVLVCTFLLDRFVLQHRKSLS